MLLALTMAAGICQADSALRLKPYPQPLPIPDWLEQRQTFIFGVNTADECIERGVEIICGGTNAAGPGFSGGPYVIDDNNVIVDMNTRQPVDVAAIRKRVDDAHAKGLKVIGELMRMWDPETLNVKHPDWQELPYPGAKPVTPAQAKKMPLPVTGCWNSPYGDFYIKQTIELVKQLGWDGANLDGFGCWTQCYCKYCREAYKHDTGKDIPYKPAKVEKGQVAKAAIDDLTNPEFRRYLKWRLNRFTQFVDKWMKGVQAYKPDFAAFFWSTGPGRWWHWSFAPLAECSDGANRLLSAPIVELFWDFPPDQGNGLLPSFVVRYYRGLTAERPVWMLPYYCTQGQQPAVAPPVECAYRLLTVITNGGRAAQGKWQNNNGLPQDYYTKLIKDRAPYTEKAKSTKWAAMFVSESSRLMYNVPARSALGNWWIGSGVDTPDIGKIPPSERRLPYHMESAIGVFRAALEEHLPLDIITEQDVEDGDRLNEYKVLIMPNTACVSDKAARKIKSFVERGGGLVAMHESSLYNEFADHRQDFALADLFKVSFDKLDDHTARWPNYKPMTFVRVKPHEITTDPVLDLNRTYGSDALDYLGWSTVVKAKDGAEVIATRDADPFIVISNTGGGRVAYIAADIGQAYFVTPYQYERKLIANSIRWAAGDAKPPVKVTAPMCVQATFYEQSFDGTHRRVVHLLNEINTTGARALPEGNSSMREEIVPISGIKVAFTDPNIKRVHLEPEGQDLQITKTTDGAEVTVPELKLHSMVVAEMGEQ